MIIETPNILSSATGRRVFHALDAQKGPLEFEAKSEELIQRAGFPHFAVVRTDNSDEVERMVTHAHRTPMQRIYYGERLHERDACIAWGATQDHAAFRHEVADQLQLDEEGRRDDDYVLELTNRFGHNFSYILPADSVSGRGNVFLTVGIGGVDSRTLSERGMANETVYMLRAIMAAIDLVQTVKFPQYYSSHSMGVVQVETHVLRSALKWLQLVSSTGMGQDEAAAELGVSRRTIANYADRLIHWFNVRSIHQVFVLATKLGLIR